jgi:ribosome biogenesis GTPase
MDLVDDNDGELEGALEEYARIGYPYLLTSSYTGQGIEALKDALAGKMSVFIGKSGVGKTALLNQLQPGLGLRVKEVNQATGKGRHTTTNLEMFPLDSSGAIVDTPGTREFGLWAFDDDLALLFPEMAVLVGKCRFGLDCQHDEEPGCAIRKAVMDGRVSPQRYASLLTLREDMATWTRK